MSRKVGKFVTNSVKTVFIDVDGTLLTDEHELTEKNIDAVQRAVEEGFDIILCSGRTPISLFTVAEQMKYKPNHLIGFNGGVILNGEGKEIYKKTLELEYTQEIVKYIEQHPICVGVYIETDTIVVKNAPKELRSIMDKNIKRIEVEDNVSEKIDRPAMKIMAVGEPEHLKVIHDYYINKINDRFVMVYTQESILEFIPRGVNKGAAVEWLCETTGISLEDTAAMGDNYNDLEMIQKCFFTIVPKNAVDALKEIATAVQQVDNNQSAVAKVLDYLVENQFSFL